MVTDSHVSIDLDGVVSETWRQCADVLFSSLPRPYEEAERLARETFRRYPGCLLVVVRCTDGGCLAVTGSGGYVTPLPLGSAFPGQGYVRFTSLLYAGLIRALCLGRAAAADLPGAERHPH